MTPVIAHPKPRRLYIFWAIPFAGCETNYFKVVAVSESQARYFWQKYLRTVLRPYDYSLQSCGIDEIRFSFPNVGDIFGGDAHV